MIITFRTTAEIQRTREYILSNQNNDRGISVEETRLEIWGTTSDPLILQHNLEEWYTLFIQWTSMGDMKGYVYLMSENIITTSQTFTTKPAKLSEHSTNVYIGAKSDGVDPWSSGEITALEIYTITSPVEKVYQNHFEQYL